MSKRLHLLRHAKSSWDDASLPDHERPLNRRGVEACALVAADIERAGIAPGLVLCSTAVRTRETLELIEHGLGGEPVVRFERCVYEASAGQLIELIADCGAREDSVLVIGHNPAIGSLAVALTGSGSEDECAQLRAKFPTGARASLGFDCEWDRLGAGAARLEAFVRPRHLRGPG